MHSLPVCSAESSPVSGLETRDVCWSCNYGTMGPIRLTSRTGTYFRFLFRTTRNLIMTWGYVKLIALIWFGIIIIIIIIIIIYSWVSPKAYRCLVWHVSFCVKHPAWCWNHFSALRRWESSCRNRHIRCVVRRNPSPLSGNTAWCCWPWCQGWGFGLEGGTPGSWWILKLGHAHRDKLCKSCCRILYMHTARHYVALDRELHDARCKLVLLSNLCKSILCVHNSSIHGVRFPIVQNVGTFNSWLEDTGRDSQMNLSQHHLASQYPVMAKRKSLTLNHLPWRNKSGQQNKSLVTHWRHPRWLRIRESCILTQPFNTFYIISCEWNSPKASFMKCSSFDCIICQFWVACHKKI